MKTIPVAHTGTPRAVRIDCGLKWKRSPQASDLDSQNVVLFWKTSAESLRAVSTQGAWLEDAQLWFSCFDNGSWTPWESRRLRDACREDGIPGVTELAIAVEPIDREPLLGISLVVQYKASHTLGLAVVPDRPDFPTTELDQVSTIVAIDLSELMVVPALDDKPKPPNFLSFLWRNAAQVTLPTGILFKPFEPVYSKKEKGACTWFALDFGTYETSISTLSDSERYFRVMPHLRPYHRAVVSIEEAGGEQSQDMRPRVRLGARVPIVINRCQPIAPEYPELVGTPSVYMELTPGTAGPGSVGLPFDRKAFLIGQDVHVLLSALSHETIGSALGRVRRLPKLYLDTPENRDERRTHTYLETLFNWFAEHTAILNNIARVTEDAGHAIKGPSSDILFSYPVSSTEKQRKELLESVESATKNSWLGQPEVSPEDLCDEATAGIMGILYHRFGHMGLDHIIGSFHPFGEPVDEVGRRLTAACLDFGGGTIDLSLLVLSPEENVPGYVGRVQEVFGYPCGGNEINRRLGHRIKSAIVRATERAIEQGQSVPPEQLNWVRGRLNTAYQKAEEAGVKAERLRRLNAWHILLERIKRTLSDESTEYIINAPPQTAAQDNLTQEFEELGLGDLSFSKQAIKVGRDVLIEIVQEVVAPVLGKLQTWLAEHSIDVLIFSGRACRVAGFRELAEQAIMNGYHTWRADYDESSEMFRLLRHNIVWACDLANEPSLATTDDAAGKHLDKNIVSVGLLAIHVYRSDPTKAQQILIEPPDEMVRSRAIGRLHMQGQYPVRQLDEILFHPDFGDIAQSDISKLSLAGTTQAVHIGINFLGLPKLGVTPDLARILGKLLFKPGIGTRGKMGVRQIVVGFRQLSATRITMKSIEVTVGNCEEPATDSIQEHAPDETGRNIELEAGGVCVEWIEETVAVDFMDDGIIHSEIDR